MKRNDYLIRKKLFKYIVTGVMTTVALQLGNVVDGMIVGNLLGSMGNGAISASTPFVYLIQAAAILLGTGGAVAISVLLGKRDIENSNRVLGLCILFSIAYPLLFALMAPFNARYFLMITGITGELGEMVSKFITVFAIGMPVVSFVLVMAHLVNVDNNPGLSAKIHITANIVNLIMDYILVKYTPLGIAGAALSTILGYTVSGIIYIPMYIKSKDRMLKPQFVHIFSTKEPILFTVKNGFPNLMNLIMTVISVGIINTIIVRYMGNDYFSAYAVANNTQLIVQMFFNGVSSVIASVIGVLYGEKDYYGMRFTFSKVVKISLTIGTVIMALFIIFPNVLCSMYGFNNEAIKPELLTGLRLFSLSFIFFIANALTQNYYRTIGYTALSTMSGILQLIIFKIPFTIAGLTMFGFAGLFIGIICSELSAFIVINLLRISLQAMGKVSKKGFMAIPDKNENEILDLTIKGSDENAVKLSEKIIEYGSRNGLSPKSANLMGIAAEEIVSNIGRYGYKDPEEKYIDVCMSRTGDNFYLRFRDDGVPFDPVGYEPVSNNESEMTGLELIKKLAVKMTYLRSISLNNTIIEINEKNFEER